MNLDKTKLLVIGVPKLLQQLPDFAIALYGKLISPIPVDHCLTYDEHIKLCLVC